MTTALIVKEASPATVSAAADRREFARLAALHRLQLLDSPDSRTFDRITRLTAAALRVPIVLVSLVDEKRQWFKSRVGLDATETPRAISFCAHAVVDRSPLVVPDATLDIRFAGNPMVTGAPHVRAYAGIPLYTSDGHAIGALCAIDRRARVFTPEEMNTLRDAARAVEECIRSDDVAPAADAPGASAGDAEAPFHDAFMYAAVGLGHLSLEGRLLRANPYLCKMLGYGADEIAGMNVADITHPEDIASSQSLLDQLSIAAIDSRRMDKRYLRKDGSLLWGDLSLTVKKSPTGKPHYLVAVIQDITARKQAELDVDNLRNGPPTEVEQPTREAGEIVQAMRSHIRRRAEFEQVVGRHEARIRQLPGDPTPYVSYWNRHLRCEFVNAAHCARFDCSPDQVVGMTLQELFGTALPELEPYTRLAFQGHEQRIGHSIALGTGQLLTDIRLVPDRSGPSHVEGLYFICTGQRPRMRRESMMS